MAHSANGRPLSFWLSKMGLPLDCHMIFVAKYIGLR